MEHDNMTFIDAAKKILFECGNLPLSSNEIWNKTYEKKLVNTKGKTPWASMNTILLNYSINSPLKNPSKNPIVEIVGSNPMKFRLIDINKENFINKKSNKIDKLIEEKEIEKILLYQITSKELDWKILSVYNNNENIEYVLENCDEYTYIIEDKAHATLKIGKTKNNPEMRLNQLKTANPSIGLLHVFPSVQYSETELHQKFNDYQKDLEWFFFSKGLKNFLNNEIEKHNSIFCSYNIKNRLNEQENQMLSNLLK